MAVTQQQLSYLKAMGIPVWVSRDAVDVSIFESGTNQQNLRQVSKFKLPQTSLDSNSYHFPENNSSQKPSSFSNESLRDELQQATPESIVQQSSIPSSVKPVSKQYNDCSSFDLQQLQSAVIACQQCDLHGVRTQTVFGEGVINATWMIIGDAPKEDDDLQGRAFMGRAGKLLNNMLTAVGLDRSTVYLSNSIKCRPPNNRDPKKEESAACFAYLKRQIELVNPSLILIVGRIAAQHLLETKEPLARLRGKQHQISGFDIPVVVTYHPAYLLRQPRDKYKSWEDLKLARALLAKTSQS